MGMVYPGGNFGLNLLKEVSLEYIPGVYQYIPGVIFG